MTSKDEIRTWLREGKEQGATHTIIACDTFDYSDFPVHIMPDQDVRKKEAELDKVMEVYSHAIDHEPQLSERRSWHYETKQVPRVQGNATYFLDQLTESAEDLASEVAACPGFARCQGCGSIIDPHVCHCGDDAKAHRWAEHGFIPHGCDCFRSDAKSRADVKAWRARGIVVAAGGDRGD